MEVTGKSCCLEVVSLRHMAASFMEAIAVEMLLSAHRSLYYLLTMGSLCCREDILEHQGGNNQGTDDSILIEKKDIRRIRNGVIPENKDDGDSDNDDEDEDEDGEEQEDGEGDDDNASGDEDSNPGNEDAGDDAEANGEGGSDEEEEEDDEDDDDDDDEDGEDEDEEDEDEEEEEEDIPEPPTKKRK